MRTADFHFDLPPELIAQHPAARRDDSRLLVLDRARNQLSHRRFPDLLEYLNPGDVLVLNNSRVIPARLRGVNVQTGGQFEILLLEENTTNDWWTMMKPGKRARLGTQIEIRNPKSEIRNIQATVVAVNEAGHRRLQFSNTTNITDELHALGEIPLPPYIHREPGAPVSGPACFENLSPRAGSETGVPIEDDSTRYQTIYAEPPGSVAAPTAGLHFTPALLEKIRALGVQVCFVTLHVGLGTFAPVKAELVAEHLMHEERFEISAATAQVVNAAKSEGRRVIAVGTTSMRVLESAASMTGPTGSDPALYTIAPAAGRTRIFIHPPSRFKIVDSLLTNFHLPCSTLLMLVSAFASPGETSGRDLILSAYAEAIRERYRFFSYGDAMLIL